MIKIDPLPPYSKRLITSCFAKTDIMHVQGILPNIDPFIERVSKN